MEKLLLSWSLSVFWKYFTQPNLLSQLSPTINFTQLSWKAVFQNVFNKSLHTVAKIKYLFLFWRSSINSVAIKTWGVSMFCLSLNELNLTYNPNFWQSSIKIIHNLWSITEQNIVIRNIVLLILLFFVCIAAWSTSYQIVHILFVGIYSNNWSRGGNELVKNRALSTFFKGFLIFNKTWSSIPFVTLDRLQPKFSFMNIYIYI